MINSDGGGGDDDGDAGVCRDDDGGDGGDGGDIGQAGYFRLPRWPALIHQPPAAALRHSESVREGPRRNWPLKCRPVPDLKLAQLRRH